MGEKGEEMKKVAYCIFVPGVFGLLLGDGIAKLSTNLWILGIIHIVMSLIASALYFIYIIRTK